MATPPPMKRRPQPVIQRPLETATRSSPTAERLAHQTETQRLATGLRKTTRCGRPQYSAMGGSERMP